jgi:hypothetical protein
VAKEAPERSAAAALNSAQDAAQSVALEARSDEAKSPDSGPTVETPSAPRYPASSADVDWREVAEHHRLMGLRYDGKGFSEWREEWRSELKPERRAEAINAFAAFGANGLGKEAAEAILEVMRTLEMSVSDAKFDRSHLREGRYTGTMLVKMSAIRAFLPARPDYRIPPEDAVKVLSRELKEGNRHGRMFAIFALRNMGHEAVDAIPALREAFRTDADATVRCCAYVAPISARNSRCPLQRCANCSKTLN